MNPCSFKMLSASFDREFFLFQAAVQRMVNSHSASFAPGNLARCFIAAFGHRSAEFKLRRSEIELTGYKGPDFTIGMHTDIILRSLVALYIGDMTYIRKNIQERCHFTDDQIQRLLDLMKTITAKGYADLLFLAAASHDFGKLVEPTVNHQLAGVPFMRTVSDEFFEHTARLSPLEIEKRKAYLNALVRHHTDAADTLLGEGSLEKQLAILDIEKETLGSDVPFLASLILLNTFDIHATRKETEPTSVLNPHTFDFMVKNFIDLDDKKRLILKNELGQFMTGGSGRCTWTWLQTRAGVKPAPTFPALDDFILERIQRLNIPQMPSADISPEAFMTRRDANAEAFMREMRALSDEDLHDLIRFLLLVHCHYTIEFLINHAKTGQERFHFIFKLMDQWRKENPQARELNVRTQPNFRHFPNQIDVVISPQP